jgi:F-type H+-transporting ATPase subunit b
MNAFLEQFGIDWKLFLSQLINFAIILVVLKFFVYNPVLKILKERSKKIKEGLDKAEEASIRLKEVDNIGKVKIKEAEAKSVEIIKATERRAKDLEIQLQKKNEETQQRLQKEIQENYVKQQQEAKELVLKNATELIKKTVIKTIELNPEAIDEALIKKAIKEIDNGKE